MRNKPIEPPKKPEKAPFFMPSIPSLSGDVVFKPSDSTKEKNVDPDTMGKPRKFDNSPSQFLQLLQSAADMKNCKHSTYSFNHTIFLRL